MSNNALSDEPATYARVTNGLRDDEFVYVTIWSNSRPPRDISDFIKDCVPSLQEIADMCHSVNGAVGVHYLMDMHEIPALRSAMQFFGVVV